MLSSKPLSKRSVSERLVDLLHLVLATPFGLAVFAIVLHLLEARSRLS